MEGSPPGRMLYYKRSFDQPHFGLEFGKSIGWHKFRHTYSTLLIANGENVKVVQELMRHASSRFTLEIYSQACLIAKREAQRRLVEAIFPERTEDREPAIQGSSVSLAVNRIDG